MDVNDVRRLRTNVINVFHGDGDHILTQADIDLMFPKGREDGDRTREYVSRYRGLPIKYLGAKDDPELWNSIDNRIKVAYMLARYAGKSVDQTFTQSDLDTIAAKLGLSDEAKAQIGQYITGKNFLQTVNDWASGVIGPVIDAIDKVPGTDISIPGIVGGFEAIGKAFEFLTKPENWIAILAGVAGVGLIVMGGMRFVRGEGMSQ